MAMLHENICISLIYLLKPKKLNRKAFKNFRLMVIIHLQNNSFTKVVGGTVSFKSHFHGICVGLVFSMQSTLFELNFSVLINHIQY